MDKKKVLFNYQKSQFKSIQEASKSTFQFFSFENEKIRALDILAKYFGSQASGLLSSLDKSNQDIVLPVAVNLTGDFSKPKVKTDMKSALTSLTKQLVAQQKGKLKKKAIDELGKQIKNKDIKNVVDGVLGNSNNTKENKKEVKEKIKEKTKKALGAIGGFFK